MPKNSVTLTTYPEVTEYEQAKASLQGFMQTHETIFETYETLVADYNQKMEAADKLVRSNEVSCSDWDLYSESTKYDPEALYNRMGREGFLQAGGSLETVTKFGIDKKRFDAAVTRGEVPKEIAGEVRTVSPRYHAPKSK